MTSGPRSDADGGAPRPEDETPKGEAADRAAEDAVDGPGAGDTKATGTKAGREKATAASEEKVDPTRSRTRTRYVDDGGEDYDGPTRVDPVARILLALGAVVLVAGAIVFVVGLVRHHEAETLADHREEAIGVASQVLVNAYSFDHENVQKSLDALKQDSTGDFLQQQDQWGPDVRKRVEDQKAVTKATVNNAAVEDFDDDGGTARVLFVFTAQSEREKLPSVTGRQAAVVDLQRVDDAWKVSGVTPVGVIVPVGDSSASVQGLGGAAGGGGGSAAPSSAAKTPAPSSKAPASSPAPASKTPAR